MAQTTESASTSATTKEGVQIKGKDVILLNAPEVRLSPDTPLLTEAQDVAGAINELFMLDPGGGDDWFPPEDWLTVPEPEPWEACFLVDMQKTLTHQLYFGDPDYNGNQGYGHITIDWGDGTVDSYDGKEHDENGNTTGGVAWENSLKHTYSNNGQYIVKVTTTEHNCLLYRADDNGASSATLLIAKLGSRIQLCTYDGASNLWGAFRNCARLHWVVIKSNTQLNYATFQGCYTLRKIDLETKITKIPDYCFASTYSLKYPDFSQVVSVGYNAFSSAYALKKISLPKCTEIGDYAFNNLLTLSEIDAPLCKSVGNNAFYCAYSLEKATFADGCTFGSNAFYYCYNLYPRPDGSTN